MVKQNWLAEFMKNRHMYDIIPINQLPMVLYVRRVDGGNKTELVIEVAGEDNSISGYHFEWVDGSIKYAILDLVYLYNNGIVTIADLLTTVGMFSNVQSTLPTVLKELFYRTVDSYVVSYNLKIHGGGLPIIIDNDRRYRIPDNAFRSLADLRSAVASFRTFVSKLDRRSGGYIGLTNSDVGIGNGTSSVVKQLPYDMLRFIGMI